MRNWKRWALIFQIAYTELRSARLFDLHQTRIINIFSNIHPVNRIGPMAHGLLGVVFGDFILNFIAVVMRLIPSIKGIDWTSLAH
jgi:hypothetical protein